MKVKVKVKSSPTLPNPMDCSLPGSSVLGIFQARATFLQYLGLFPFFKKMYFISKDYISQLP